MWFPFGFFRKPLAEEHPVQEAKIYQFPVRPRVYPSTAPTAQGAVKQLKGQMK